MRDHPYPVSVQVNKPSRKQIKDMLLGMCAQTGCSFEHASFPRAWKVIAMATEKECGKSALGWVYVSEDELIMNHTEAAFRDLSRLKCDGAIKNANYQLERMING